MSGEEEKTDKRVLDCLRTSLINFLLDILPTLLGCTRIELQKVLASKSSFSHFHKFFCDQETRSLTVKKEFWDLTKNNLSGEISYERDGLNGKPDKNEGEEMIQSTDDLSYIITVSSEIKPNSLNCPSVVILKKSNVHFLQDVVSNIDDETDRINTTFIAARVQLMNLGSFVAPEDFATLAELKADASSNKQAHDPIISNSIVNDVINYLQSIVDPILITDPSTSTALARSETFLTSEKQDDAAFITKRNVLKARQKLTELLVALQQLQQNSEVPLVHLDVDKIIVKYTEQCKIQGVEFSAEKFIADLGENCFQVISQLQHGVQKWNKEIQKVLSLDRDPKLGSASDEIQFWLNLEQCLLQISQQLKSPNVEATFAVLQASNKLTSTLSFEKHTGLKSKLDMVQNVNLLMRDFPINDLLSARSINQLITSVRQIFNHLRRLKHVMHYPFERAFLLCEAISRDLNQQLYQILSAHRLMLMPFEAFDLIFSNCLSLSRVWEEGSRSFKDIVRELMKRRSIINVLPSKFQYVHTILLNRVNEIRSVRFEHQKLKNIVSRVIPHNRKTDSQFAQELAAAYAVFQDVDPLDVSRVGVENFKAAKKQYSNKIDHVESQISNVLRDRLGAARTGIEMFRVFSQFNSLFFRPRIQSAIQQYQATLIEQVGDDLRELQIKFKRGFESSRSCLIGSTRGIPHICGKIIWYRQLEKKVQECLQRMEDVLGKAWEQHVDGKNLYVMGNDFLKKLNSQTVFDTWIKKVKAIKDFNFQEVRCFTSLGVRVPYSIKLAAEETKWMYPYHMTLQESLHTFFFACQRLKKPELQCINPLIADFHGQILELLDQGFKLTWESDNISLYTTTLCKKVYIFESKLEELEMLTQQISDLLESIGDIHLHKTAQSFLETHGKIQEIVTQLYLQDYVNLEQYANQLNLQLESVLLKRLQYFIDRWILEFTNWPFSGSDVIKTGSLHAFKFGSGQLHFYPPVEVARQLWMNHFYQTLGSICSLPKLVAYGKHGAPAIKTSAPNVSHSKNSECFDYLLQCLPNKLHQALTCINKTISDLSRYVGNWLKYQYLWQVELSTLVAKLGSELSLWQRVLSEIRASRTMFDTTEERKIFGPIVVDFATAQHKIIRKFESYHQELLSIFGTKVSEHARQLLSDLRREIEVLEGELDSPKIFNSNDHEALSDAQKLSILSKITQFVLCIKDARTKTSLWAGAVQNLETSEKLLERHCYSFPPNWSWIASVISEWEKFQQLLKHNSLLLDRNYLFFKKFVSQQSVSVQERMSALYTSWATSRPIDGNLSSNDAFQIISRFESKIKEIRKEFDQISQVEQSLEISQAPNEVKSLIYTKSVAPDQFLSLTPGLIEAEIICLRDVWLELSKIYEVVDALRETPWSAASPKKIRTSLAALSEDLRKIPPKYRQYEVFEDLQKKLETLMESNSIITDLQSEALKDRHWRRLLEHLGLRNIGISKLTLGLLWDAELEKHESEIRDILVQAQGELALEEFLSVVKTVWTGYELCLYVFKNRCKLIKGWDELFSLLDDHMNSLQSMKLSPYYKTFQEDATTWDEKLSRVRGLVESWIEVQRKWVYLEGVFTDSADIQALLPNEFSRFCSIDRDFLAIMKRTAARPKLLELAFTDGLQRSLDRISDLLSKIQKALGDYLERQRHEFPRFYFVGDEDLLEMIGNSKNIKMVQRHCGKMFSGIATFKTDENDSGVITKMASREGEEVEFLTPISVANYPSLNSWLRACEKEMALTLADLLGKALKRFEAFNTDYAESEFFKCFAEFPCQILLLCIQIEWTALCTSALRYSKQQQLLPNVLNRCVRLLNLLSNRVIYESDKFWRLKILNLITEVIYQRDLCQFLIDNKISCETDFHWLKCMRFYYTPEAEDATKRVTIRIGSANFRYGFEYLGVTEKLVQTSLTNKCFFALTQALHLLFGGNPFGPAGTGKTETVKALGHQLGRFVLVFCCDKTFDFQAIGRIFVGLCQVGAWGCFDEFNRLEERILSACSEQILTIQTGLKSNKKEIDLLNKTVPLNHNIRIFVTMNPGYAGRSNLPDNLKQLFREIAMVNPDKAQITEVLLYSQGFQTAGLLAGKVVALFDLCEQQLSSQTHYDFGLRALKNVLSSAGILKQQLLAQQEEGKTSNENLADTEKAILIQSICNTVVPKLVVQDIPLLRSLIQGVFPQSDLYTSRDPLLEEEVRRICQLRHFDCTPAWIEKVLQLNQIQKLSHGMMLVGPVGSGKTAVWTTLLEAMEFLDGVKGQSYVLDPKSGFKDLLYGCLDRTTLEWTDGIFTSILRKIINSIQGGAKKRHWIVFDGDVDPEWAENLNSVLDDNKVLTLPNGERLELPNCVRIIFEVDDLRSATLATISRCGMVWFNETVLSVTCITSHFLKKMRCDGVDEAYTGLVLPQAALATSFSLSVSNHPEFFEGVSNKGIVARNRISEVVTEEGQILDRQSSNLAARDGLGIQSTLGSTESYNMSSLQLKSDAKSEPRVRWIAVDILLSFFESDGFVTRCIQEAEKMSHIMEFTTIRIVESIFCLLRKHINQLVEFCELNGTCDMVFIEKYVTKILLYCICWGCGSSMISSSRIDFASKIISFSTMISLPSSISNDETILDFYVNINDAEWYRWKDSVVPLEIDQLQAQNVNLVVETVDTIRHRNILSAWIEQKTSFILCGPAGSGKTMTLTTTLKSLGDVSIAFLNFSSGTTSEVLLKTFDHYCEYTKTSSGMILRPSEPGKWLIVFADEINLPEPDEYNTQQVIMFIRQIQENDGFWKMIDSSTSQWCWVKLERILFAGACNPPTDPGRHPMSNRFLRHVPLLFVDFPGLDSLRQIYGSLNSAILRRIPALSSYASSLTNTMVSFYLASQAKFTTESQPHYIYSPRELTRWKSALHESLYERDNITFREFIRLVLHEGLRTFQDRLVEEEERLWTDSTLDDIILQNFPESKEFLTRPILFSRYLTQQYTEASRDDLRQLMENRLKMFNEEQLNVHLVFFDQFLDHIIRISRVLHQPLGHLLLVGASGVGKTILSKFVSWMNGLEIFQIKAGRNYNTAAFEADLRTVMKRVGIRKEKITFIFDESNALGPAFIERMNALLANGEVPGLFEGDELIQLISEIRQSHGAQIGQEDHDLFAYFTKEVQRNLHIIFTMNPANSDFRSCQATSPALFNRCVVNWFGDWSHDTLLQVGYQLTRSAPLTISSSSLNIENEEAERTLGAIIVSVHEVVVKWNDTLKDNGKFFTYFTPRDFLDFIKHFIQFIQEKENERLDNAMHLSVGLTKLKETEIKVEELQQSLAVKEVELQNINKQAEEKMQLIVKQQAIAEERKKDVELLAADLDSKATLISKRRLEVGDELKLVEPLLREAEAAVSNIPKRNLDELRAMANPPQMVKFAVEAVVVMLNNMGMNPTTWEECRKTLKAGDFINRVVTFDSMNTSPLTVQRIKQKYLDTDNWDVDKIMRASKAAGPLAIWVQSSIDFQVIVQKVEPLREEIDRLEEESSVNAEGLKKTQAQITDLEKTLENYKKEYAQLITEVQRIKQEISAVQNKVKRSSDLLTKLGSEKMRWSSASESSKDRILTVLGDCILSAGFATYLGFFEHKDRTYLIGSWKRLLSDASISYNSNLSLMEYLSKPSQRHEWRSCALPDDHLSMENAIMLHRYIRYPLVIDPSGQATFFILNLFAKQKIVKTSFTDTNFLKNLESALRFGTPLLIQDIKTVDPILSSVLNRETHKAGGRTLIHVGDSEIDFSPSFQLFLTTRDPTARFPPDLCSRVTLVNFTLTPSSLQNQCLNLLLKFERPDIDKKRSDLLKLQGEFQIRLRELEDSLLYSLSNVKGNILDDDNLVDMLETLKAQAAEVEKEVASADAVMVEIEKVSNVYSPLSEAASRIYFTLQSMHHLAFFYRYDLNFFETIFLNTLKGFNESSNLVKGGDAEKKRLNILSKLLFKNIFSHCSLGLTHNDSVVLGLELSRIYAVAECGHPIWQRELDLLLQSSSTSLFKEQATKSEEDSAEASCNSPTTTQKSELTDFGEAHKNDAISEKFLDIISAEQKGAVEALTSLPVFKDLKSHMALHSNEWKTFLYSNKPESCIPLKFTKSVLLPSPHNTTPPLTQKNTMSLQESDSFPAVDEGDAQSVAQRCLWEALIVKTFRLDVLLSMLVRFTKCVLGPEFTDIPPLPPSHMQDLILYQLKPTVPLILITSPGFDPGAKIVSLANENNESLASIAMGSEEGDIIAEKCLRSAAESGTWILLKNAHLSPSWLLKLERLLFKLQFHDHFRIFLTMELNEKVPQNFFRISFVLYFEPPAGLRSSIQRTYTQFYTPSDTQRPPAVARNRLLFLLAFLHAVILERRRYTPHGWSKKYEFSDSDLQCGILIIQEYVNSCSMISNASQSVGTTPSYMESVDPLDIPFDAIRALLRDLVYGGRLDNVFDTRALSSFIDYLFTAEAFKSDFVLAPGYEEPEEQGGGLIPPFVAPDLSRFQNHYVKFVSTSMDAVSHPVWIGLVPQAYRFISASQGQDVLKKWHTLLVQSGEELKDFGVSHGEKTTLVEPSRGSLVFNDMKIAPVESHNSLATLLARSLKLLESLPPRLHDFKSNEDCVTDPLFRYFDRETHLANNLLRKIETSLLNLSDVCAGRQPFTNSVREFSRQIERDVEPPMEWILSSAHQTTRNITLSDWLLDFCHRIAQLALIGNEYGAGSIIPDNPLLLQYQNNLFRSILNVQSYNVQPPHLIWLGGLQHPAAFLNATRQRAAHHLQVSLDDLEADFYIGEPLADTNSFLIGGATIENASWNSHLKCLVLSNVLVETLPLILLQWRPRKKNNVVDNSRISIPVFLNDTRSELITTLELPIHKGDGVSSLFQFCQRGVAIILWRKAV